MGMLSLGIEGGMDMKVETRVVVVVVEDLGEKMKSG
jgi:hypothetical protein